jgi:hypothetical protein
MSIQNAVLFLLAAGLAGCATPGPYAEVSGEKVLRADLNDEQVLVMGVDGRLIPRGALTETLEPGLRMVLLATTRRDRRGENPSSVVPLNAKPCLRYYFVARHESMSDVQPWQLVLKNVEPIPECVAKYPQHQPVPANDAAKQ